MPYSNPKTELYMQTSDFIPEPFTKKPAYLSIVAQPTTSFPQI